MGMELKTMTEKFKLTKDSLNEFFDMAVDASGSAGWRWFEKKYGINYEEFIEFLVSIQQKAVLFDSLIIENQTILDTISQVKIFNNILEQQLSDSRNQVISHVAMCMANRDKLTKIKELMSSEKLLAHSSAYQELNKILEAKS